MENNNFHTAIETPLRVRVASQDQPMGRREFLRSSVSAGAAVAVVNAADRAIADNAGPLPTRILGRTGQHVTTLERLDAIEMVDQLSQSSQTSAIEAEDQTR